jgi:hypothetical protein
MEYIHQVISQTAWAISIVAIGFKLVTIKAVQSILCTEPHKPIFVLRTTKNGVIGQAVLYLIMAKVIGLCRTIGNSKTEQQEQYRSFQFD